MDVSRCKTVDLVRKEFWAYLLVHNLIRGAMAEAPWRYDLMPPQISLQGARQSFLAFRGNPKRVSAKVAGGLSAAVLEAIASQRVGDPQIERSHES